MTQIETTLAIIGALLALTAVAAGLYAYFKSGSQEAVIKRLREERDDYLSRINFIEPRFAAAQEQNELLRSLTDPSERLKDIGDAIAQRGDRILAVLDRQSTILQSIEEKVHVHPEAGQ